MRDTLKAPCRLAGRFIALCCSGCMPEQGLTLGARKAIEKAVADADALGHGYVGTEHILLGILRQPECSGTRAIAAAGVEPNELYTDIMAD